MTMSSESMDNIEPSSSTETPAETKTEFCLEDVTVEFIKDNFENPRSINLTSVRKKVVKKDVVSGVHGYKLQPAKNATTLVFTKMANRDADRDLQMQWRQTLQQQGQVCCPLPKCQVSYCSLRGLILHYQACTGVRDEVESVKCKICRHYVSCKISLAHHNRLLHRGPPMKAVDTFIEGQDRMNNKRKQQVEIGEVKTTKSMRQVRKPARFRDPTEEDDEASAEEKLAQFGLPLTTARSKKSPASATVTSDPVAGAVPLEDIRKYTFLRKMGLTRANDEGSPFGSFVVMDDSLEENEEDLPPDKTSFSKAKPNSAISTSFRAQFRRIDGSDADLFQGSSPEENDKGETTNVVVKIVKDLALGEDGMPVRRKRGRPRKIRPEEVVAPPSPPPPPPKPIEVLSPPPKKVRKNRLKHYEDPTVNQHQEMTDGIVGNDMYSELEQKTIIRQTFKKFGRLVCPREACRKPLISLPGYFYHVKNCTKQVKKVVKEENSEKVVKEENSEKQNVINENDKSFLGKEKKDSLQKTLKQNGKVLCPNYGCPKSFLSVAGYMYHIKNCKPQVNSVKNKSEVRICPIPVKVECGVCGETSKDAASFQTHALEFHNGLARKSGDSLQFTEEEQKDALRKTLKQVGRLICPSCKKAYISLQGFKYHSQSCIPVSSSTPRQHSDNRPFPLEEQKEILKQTLATRGVLRCTRPQCGLDFSAVEAFLEHSSKCREEAGPVTCGVCKTFCNSEAQFRHHAMSQHNGLARPSGQSQIFTEEDECSILRNTIRYLKKLYCLRPECGKAFISLGGYQYHVKQCGQESQYQDCPVCGKKLKMLSLRYHMKASHPPSPPPVPEGEERTDLNAAAESGQPKRKAAKRAREKVQEIARGLGSDDDVSSKQEKSYIPPHEEAIVNDIVSYTKPTLVHVSTRLFAEWRTEGETTGTIKCKNTGCSQEFALPWQMRSHYLACTHSGFDLNYTCRCGKKTRSEAMMLIHQESHLEESQNSDYEGRDKDSDYMSSKGSRSTKSQVGYKFFQSSGRKQNSWEPFPLAIEWTSHFRKKHYQDVLFSEWRPKIDWWQELSTDEYCVYWPTTRCSARFQTVAQKTAKSQVSSDWKQLKLFEATIEQDQNSSTFFVGGPVWAMAWCPTPLSKKTAQYLAVSCHHSMNDKMVTEKVQAGPGTIQIWKITESTHPRSSFCTSLELSICHDEGYVCQIEWCPSGCWEEETMQTKDDTAPSLGLLAAACSSGKINIFCVPHAFSRPSSSSTYKVKPSIVLQTDPVLASSGHAAQLSPCLSVSWLRSKNHNLIAGGFADGRVALWDLKLRSPLLCLTTKEQQTIFSPFQIFQAHMCAVYDVTWAPAHHGQHLCTVGLDRQVHFWSTDDLSLPTNSVGRGRVLKLEWSPNWCGIFAAQDDCYNHARNYMGFIDSGYQPNGSRSFTVHNGCIWDVSVNDWLNCAVSCDSSGEVVGNVLCHVMQNLNYLKGMERRRFPIYRIELHELQDAAKNNTSSEQSTESSDKLKMEVSETDPKEDELQQAADLETCVSNSEDLERTNNSVENSLSVEENEPEAVKDSVLNSAESNQVQKSDPSTKKEEEKGRETKPFKIFPTSYEECVAKYGIVFCDAAILKGHLLTVPQPELTRLMLSSRMNATHPHAFPLSAVNRVCWNPNFGSHLLLASGNHSGLVRVHRIMWLHRGRDDNLDLTKTTSESSEDENKTEDEDMKNHDEKQECEASTSVNNCVTDDCESVSSAVMDGEGTEGDLFSDSVGELSKEDEMLDTSGTIENEMDLSDGTR